MSEAKISEGHQWIRTFELLVAADGPLRDPPLNQFFSEVYSMTKAEAIDRLDRAGFKKEAASLKTWRAENGTNQGWDGWIEGKYPLAAEFLFGRNRH